jgi:hypothetical protein
MKYSLLNILFFLLSLSGFTQETISKDKTSSSMRNYLNISFGDEFYQLYDHCEEENSVDNCWKFGLFWDEGIQDYSNVSSSKIQFYYFPKKSSLCHDIAFYELVPKNINDNIVWQYNDHNLTITIKMIEVETFFGYQLSDIRITNNLGESCFGPNNLAVKLN